MQSFVDGEVIPLDEGPLMDGPGSALFGVGAQIFGVIATVFWVWMIIECLRKDPDRYMWIFLIMFLHTIGALVYFVLRWLPANQVRLPKFLQNMTRGKELRRLEIATQQIGNAHQFVQYGDALRETNQPKKALEAYRQATAKEADNMPALWGAAQVSMRMGDFAEPIPALRKMLAKDPQYKFGDVSMALGKALVETNQRDDALEHFRKHVVRWRHPEGLYLLAELELEAGNADEGTKRLRELIMDVDSSPKNIARRHGMWKSRARKLLKRNI